MAIIANPDQSRVTALLAESKETPDFFENHFDNHYKHLSKGLQDKCNDFAAEFILYIYSKEKLNTLSIYFFEHFEEPIEQIKAGACELLADEPLYTMFERESLLFFEDSRMKKNPDPKAWCCVKNHRLPGLWILKVLTYKDDEGVRKILRASLPVVKQPLPKFVPFDPKTYSKGS